MEVAYYNLSGGINQASTKTELGLDTKKVYWSDSENIEIFQNKGICKQKGNTLFLELPVNEEITGLNESFSNNKYKLIITTVTGKIYVYDDTSGQLTLINKTLSGTRPIFTNFLSGTIIATESDTPFYLGDDSRIDNCNIEDNNSEDVIAECICTFKGRLWVSSGSTIYFSALGTYNDFSTEGDAGYISDFHTDTSNIIAIKPYKDYLAIYKHNSVYLLCGNNPTDFAIVPFASKGCNAPLSIVNVENKQYFLSNGIFALEQVGELNQIQLGSEISRKIKPELEKFNQSDLKHTFCLHYEARNQVWYFFPYPDDEYFHTIWINDYVNNAWYKRVVPQDLTTGCIFKYKILSADKNGKIYTEDFGTTFDGTPIHFMWKSPFFAISNAHHRKIIDEFYFIMDEEFDNNFDFSVYKDYDSQNADDLEKIYSVHLTHLIWADDNTNDKLPCHWTPNGEEAPIWSVNRNTMEKAEISESNYAIQLCVEGSELQQSCAIIGLQFREIYNDD